MLNGLDLFSGIGGLSIALNEWVRPIAYCENDRYAQAVLLSRMRDGCLFRAPIWGDVRTLSGSDIQWYGIDIIYGGFPCQDISAAGAGIGLGGERSGLFNHIARLVEETNPSFIFLENVPAIRTRGLNGIVQTFTELGYDCRWTVVSAEEVGAPHLRKRWFLLAHSPCELRKRSRSRKDETRNNEPTDCSKTLANADGAGFKHDSEMSEGIDCESWWVPASGRRWWDSEPAVGRVADGIPNRVDRLRGLGNAVVPLQAKEAFKKLCGIKGDLNGKT